MTIHKAIPHENRVEYEKTKPYRRGKEIVKPSPLQGKHKFLFWRSDSKHVYLVINLTDVNGNFSPSYCT